MFRWRALLFVLGMSLIVFLVLVITCNGMLLRGVNKYLKTNDGGKSCNSYQRLISESNLKDGFCIQKYLKDGTVCRKQDLAYNWETATDSSSYKTLDPSCCKQAKSYITWPAYVLGLCSLFFTMFFAIIIGSDIYLSDSGEQLNKESSKKLGLADYLALGIALALIIGFVIYLLVAGSYKAPAQNPNATAYYNMKKGIADDKYEPVPKAVLKSSSNDASSNENLCYKWDFTSMPKAVVDSSLSDYSAATVGFRVTWLARNTIMNNTNSGGAIICNKQFRTNAVAHENNSLDAFGFIKGTAAQVNTYLQNTELCVRALASDQDVYVVIEQVNLTYLDTRCLFDTEQLVNPYVPPSETALISHTPHFYGTNNFEHFAAGTKGNSYTKLHLNQSLFATTLQGKLMTKTSTGVIMPYALSKIKVQCYDNQMKPYSMTQDTDGIFTASDVYIFPGGSYNAKCEITDTSTNVSSSDYTKYQYNEFDVLVPGNSAGEVSAGEIMLLTRTGKYYDNDNTSWANQTTKIGSLSVAVVNGVNGKPIDGVNVVLTEYWTAQATEYASSTTTAGTANFSNVVYNAYTATANDEFYQQATQRLTVQKDKNVIEMVLVPIDADTDYTLVFENPNTTADFDLNLTVKGHNGDKCTVSAINRYCAYARHVRDNFTSTGSSEVIKLQKFSVSTYMAWIRPAPTYASTCHQSIGFEKKNYNFLNRRNRRLISKKVDRMADLALEGSSE